MDVRQRITRALRLALLAAGIGALVLLPVSLIVRSSASWDRGHDIRLEVEDCSVKLWTLRPGMRLNDRHAHLRMDVQRLDLWRATLYGTTPTFDDDGMTVFITLPLWLVSALCLVWPVTSFMVGRRIRRRGFPVRPAELGDQRSEVLD